LQFLCSDFFVYCQWRLTAEK